MTLQELLDKFSNAGFLLTIEGLCYGFSFYDYENLLRKKEHWKYFKNREVKDICIISTDGEPELCIRLEE